MEVYQFLGERYRRRVIKDMLASLHDENYSDRRFVKQDLKIMFGLLMGDFKEARDGLIIPEGITDISYRSSAGLEKGGDGYIYEDEDAINGRIKYCSTICFTEGRQEIKPGTFVGLDNIKKIIFPKSMEEIGEYAFEGCYDVTAIECKGESLYLKEGAFENVGLFKCEISVPENFRKARQWGTFGPATVRAKKVIFRGKNVTAEAINSFDTPEFVIEDVSNKSNRIVITGKEIAYMLNTRKELFSEELLQEKRLKAFQTLYSEKVKEQHEKSESAEEEGKYR